MNDEKENDGLVDPANESDFTMSHFDWAALDICIWMDIFYFDLDKLVKTI